MELFTVAFWGHRYLEHYFEIEKHLCTQVRRILAEKEYVIFLVGRHGEFDQCVSSVIHRIKREYRGDNSELELVLPYITAEFRRNRESFESYYDKIGISDIASRAHPKAAIQIRNREMVDRADLIICFCEKLFGGVYQTLTYAKKQGKPIVNLADLLDSNS